MIELGELGAGLMIEDLKMIVTKEVVHHPEEVAPHLEENVHHLEEIIYHHKELVHHLDSIPCHHQGDAEVNQGIGEAEADHGMMIDLLLIEFGDFETGLTIEDLELTVTEEIVHLEVIAHQLEEIAHQLEEIVHHHQGEVEVDQGIGLGIRGFVSQILH